MEFVDLSREIYHRTQTHPSHPPVVMTVWNDHSEKKVAGKTTFSSKAMSLAMSDHAGTHVDAPVHFDPRPGAASIDQVPLEKFYTQGICLDLSHVPLKHAIEVAEMEAALAASGQEIRPGDTVLIHMGVNARLLGKPGYLHDFPGLALESVHWLAGSACSGWRQSARRRRGSPTSWRIWPAPSGASPISSASTTWRRWSAEAASASLPSR